MLNQKPESVRRVTCIGAGPIGGGWAAHFLAQGYQVTSYLHDASEYDGLMRLLEAAWSSLEAIGLAPGASLDNFNWSTDLGDTWHPYNTADLPGVFDLEVQGDQLLAIGRRGVFSAPLPDRLPALEELNTP